MMPKRSEWWLTPIWELQTDFTPEFHEELLDEIYGIAKNISTGIDKDPKDSLWNYDTPHLSTLKEKILKIASDTVLKQIQEAHELNLKLEYSMGWVNVIGKDEGIEAHSHNDCSLVATYYIKAPENCGDLVLLNTRNIIDNNGNFLYTGKSELEHIHIKPVEGKLILFPAYAMHEVQANKSNELRISLSTDIRQIVDRTAPNAMVLKSWCNSFLRIRENV
jgi:uncharacterized protein (TIGR02466 family)